MKYNQNISNTELVDNSIKKDKQEKKLNNNKWFMIGLIIIVCVVFPIIMCCFMHLFLNPKVQYEAEYNDHLSFYHDSNYDLLVSGASKNQVEEYSKQSYIKNLVPASKISLNVQTSSDEDYRDFLIFDSTDSLEFTEFTENRLISKIESKDFVYVDYKFCKLYNVSLGDNIGIYVNGEKKDYCISRVYRTDYFYSDGIIVTTKENLPLSSKSQFMYIKSNNKNELINHFNSYKPLGTLLDKKSTQTEEDYQKYLNNFNSKNYYDSYVTESTKNIDKFEQSYSGKIKSSMKNFIICISIISFFCLAILILCYFPFMKKINRYIQDNGKKGIYKFFSILDSLFIVSIIISIIVTYCLLPHLAVYYTLQWVIKNTWLWFLLPFASCVIGWIATLFAIKKA